ncbi:MAG: hypothetical protein WCJ01_07605 [Ignavibacteria bacterium]
MNKRFVSNEEASELISQLSLEFTVINNQADSYPAFELCPIAPKILTTQKHISAVLINLDGCTISTNRLKLNALEYVVRQVSGRFETEQWRGLDRIIDIPNILDEQHNNPVEYLIQRYHNFIKIDYFKRAYFHSVLWTLILGPDQERKDQTRHNLQLLGCGEMLNDAKLAEYTALKEFTKYNSNVITNYFLHKYGRNLNIHSFGNTVKAAEDIFYKRYFEILELIKLGEGHNLAEEILNEKDEYFVEPIAEVAVFFALIKGWLGEEVETLFDQINNSLKVTDSQNYRISDIEQVKRNLIRLAKEFEADPARIAIVSSDTLYESTVIGTELLNLISTQVRLWKISDHKKNFIFDKLTDPQNIIDAIVTRGDINDIRLKPHRDLYSIALLKLGIPRTRFNEVLGIENNENGIIALRSAGIGLCVALPDSKYNMQSVASAAYVVSGGYPEIMLYYNCFMTIE